MSSLAPLRAVDEDLRLAVEYDGRASLLAEGYARYPCCLRTPRARGAAVWAYLGGYGGGLVDGDRVRMRVRVGDDGACFCGTQAAGKVYRCPLGAARQDVALRVRDGALLAWLPDHLCCFAGARFAQRIDIDLAAGGSIALLDSLGTGRSAGGERWAFAGYESRIVLRHDGVELLRDAVELRDRPPFAPVAARLRRYEALATVLLLGPRVRGLAEALLTRCAEAPLQAADGVDEYAAPLGANGCLWRLAAADAQVLHARLRADLGPLSAQFGGEPWTRRY